MHPDRKIEHINIYECVKLVAADETLLLGLEPALAPPLGKISTAGIN